MKRLGSTFRIVTIFAALQFPVHDLRAQGYDTPLTVQGLDRSESQSAASRAAGGLSFSIRNDPGLMFVNPATLQSLSGIKLSVGGLGQYRSASQDQEYAPLKYYSNFSLLMEGLTGGIPNPDTANPAANPGDTVQRAFDNLGPNWSRSKDSWIPAQALLGIPFTIAGNRFTFGLGVVRYATLDYYYQNNNVLSPSILSVRPDPVLRPPNDASPLIADWSQHITSREGSISGYGVALSGSLFGDLSLGVSAMLLDGKSDDVERLVGRGTLTFYFNYFRLDSLNDRITSVGTSDYRGQEFTFSGIYRGKHLTAGFSVKPPTPITRDFAAAVEVDTAGSSALTAVSGQDRLTLPWRGRIGAAISVREDLTFGMEYEIRPYASAVYRRPDGTETNPWLSSSVFHVGAEYLASSWLTVRAGLRGQGEVFEPEGNPIEGNAVSTTVYSAGCGLLFGDLRLNLTYEYALMKYDDIWSSAISRNRESFNTLFADVTYEIPSLW